MRLKTEEHKGVKKLKKMGSIVSTGDEMEVEVKHKLKEEARMRGSLD